MKKLFSKSFFLAVFFLVIYIVGLILGACAVSVYPIYYKQKNYFSSRAREIAQEHLVGVSDTLEHMSSPNVYVMIYDYEGNLLRYATPRNLYSDEELVLSLEAQLPVVLSGKEIYRPALAQISQRQMNDIMVVAGVPIKNQDSISGAVFLVKNLMDLPEAIMGYCLYFTIFYWLSAFAIAVNIRKSKKLDELRQNYIANVTHALKTPVASIKALSETLCDGVEPDPDQQKVYYGMILREANRQGHMIRDILELSKLQSNGMDFTKTKLRAAEIIEPVLDKYATLCDCMDISLHVSENIAVLPPLYTNAACIKQILEILLDNAIKFTPESGDIWLEAFYTRKQATICVRDNGIGISKDALPHVFDRFFKYSHDFNSSGSGLGLAIAKEIAVGLKERIWAESEAGKGAAFFFTIHLK